MTVPVARSGFDVVLKGGRVLDERNGIDGIFDVAIRAGTIAAIGRDLPATGARVDNLAGAIVAPGLIDITPTSITKPRR